MALWWCGRCGANTETSRDGLLPSYRCPDCGGSWKSIRNPQKYVCRNCGRTSICNTGHVPNGCTCGRGRWERMG